MCNPGWLYVFLFIYVVTEKKFAIIRKKANLLAEITAQIQLSEGTMRFVRNVNSNHIWSIEIEVKSRTKWKKICDLVRYGIV